MKAIIIGGGTAGLIAASTLARMGVRVTLVDNGFGTKPQWGHVHFLQPDSWQGLCDLVPGFEDEIISRGACCGSEMILGQDQVEVGDIRARPSRHCIDRTLLETLPEGVNCVVERVVSVVLGKGGVQLTLSDGRRIGGDLLIDASGRSRVSLAAITKFQGTQVDLHQGPAAGCYMSTLIDGVMLPEGQIALRGRYKGTGVLLLKEKENTWRLTLQLEQTALEAGVVEVFEEFISRPISPDIPELFSAATIIGPAQLFGAVRTERIEWREDSIQGIPWIILGDALLTTPPWLGWGIGQLVQHIQLLQDGYLRYSTVENIRASLDKSARDAWLQATMKEALRGLLAA